MVPRLALLPSVYETTKMMQYRCNKCLEECGKRAKKEVTTHPYTYMLILWSKDGMTIAFNIFVLNQQV